MTNEELNLRRSVSTGLTHTSVHENTMIGTQGISRISLDLVSSTKRVPWKGITGQAVYLIDSSSAET